MAASSIDAAPGRSLTGFFSFGYFLLMNTLPEPPPPPLEKL